MGIFKAAKLNVFLLTYPGHENEVIIDMVEHALKDYLEFAQVIVEIKHTAEPVQTKDDDTIVED